nr:hypothetical protein [uncultured Gardnerella sp.]
MLHMLNQPNGYAADYARKQVGAQTPKISVKCFRTTQKRQQSPDISQQMFPKLCSFALLKLLLKLCIIALQALIPVDQADTSIYAAAHTTPSTQTTHPPAA